MLVSFFTQHIMFWTHTLYTIAHAVFNNGDYHACALILGIKFRFFSYGFVSLVLVPSVKFLCTHAVFAVQNYNLIYTLTSILICRERVKNIAGLCSHTIVRNAVAWDGHFFSSSFGFGFTLDGSEAETEREVEPTINYRQHYLHV